MLLPAGAGWFDLDKPLRGGWPIGQERLANTIAIAEFAIARAVSSC